MSPDMTALIQQIQEATRQMDIATHEIWELRKRNESLAENNVLLTSENERLRARLVKAMAVIEHYESPEDGR
jgi:regulator of replication initiation timing